MVVLGGLLLWGLSHAESAVGFCRMSLISVFVSSALGLLWPCGPNGAFHCCQVDAMAPCAQAARTSFDKGIAPMAPLCFAGFAAQAMGHRGQRSSGSASTVNVAKSGAHLIIIMRIKIIIIIIIVFFIIFSLL